MFLLYTFFYCFGFFMGTKLFLSYTTLYFSFLGPQLYLLYIFYEYLPVIFPLSLKLLVFKNYESMRVVQTGKKLSKCRLLVRYLSFFSYYYCIIYIFNNLLSLLRLRFTSGRICFYTLIGMVTSNYSFKAFSKSC